MQTAIRCMLIRGGTSKGAYFLASDLPSEQSALHKMLLAIMGSPDPRQVDGIGGAHALTSKVAIVSRSPEPGLDFDYLFAQVSVDQPVVDTTPNCGNILAGVGPFVIERGLVPAQDPVTKVRVRTLNTGTIAELLVPTPKGEIIYDGDQRIDGVPGTAAAITINFLDTAGSVCGALLPTGKNADLIDGIPVTCIDNGMPVIILEAVSLGITGRESAAELEKNQTLKNQLEPLRLEAGRRMGMGDVSKSVVPKVCLVSPAMAGGTICTRSFIPHQCHAAIGVFAAVSVATACVLPGTTAHPISSIPPGKIKTLRIEHPTGELAIQLQVGGTAEAPSIEKAGMIRTARPLFDGKVFVRSILGSL